MADSTENPTSGKAPVGPDRPKKPYDDFPLYAHPLGYWSKKIRGNIRHFGRWGRVVKGVVTRLPDEDVHRNAALAKYQEQCGDLHAGREPLPDPKQGNVLTVADVCNSFITEKQEALDSGEISRSTYAEYRATTDRLASEFRTDDGRSLSLPVDQLTFRHFAALRKQLAEQYGPVRLGNEIGKVRSVFRHAAENGLLSRPVPYGTGFKKPKKGVIRKHKAERGSDMMEADEVREMLRQAKQPTRAMILLQVNCGFGAKDCAALPLSAVDLDRGWIVFPRPKTGIDRRCPLWPETVAALKDAIAHRPKPGDAAAAKLVFLRPDGRPYAVSDKAGPIVHAIRDTMRRAGVHRRGRGAYTARRVFRTVADETLDFVAIDTVMGHADPSMGARYRQRVDDARLVRVAECVRRWLFDGGEN